MREIAKEWVIKAEEDYDFYWTQMRRRFTLIKKELISVYQCPKIILAKESHIG